MFNFYLENKHTINLLKEVACAFLIELKNSYALL